MDFSHTPQGSQRIAREGLGFGMTAFHLQYQASRNRPFSYLDPSKLDMETKKILYQSTENDLGSLKCNLDKDKIYFIKKSRSELGKVTFDAAQFDTKTKDIEMLSDIRFATSLIVMDGKLLLPYQNKHYVIKGSNNLTDFDKLKAKTTD